MAETLPAWSARYSTVAAVAIVAPVPYAVHAPPSTRYSVDATPEPVSVVARVRAAPGLVEARGDDGSGAVDVDRGGLDRRDEPT